MAQSILAKSAPKLNYNSRAHLKLYQKILYTGSQMADLLRYYDRYIGLSKEARDRANDWYQHLEQLAEVIL